MSNLKNNGFFWSYFHECPSIKFQGNPSSVGRAATDGQTGMTKLIGAFLYYANVSNKSKVVSCLSGSSGRQNKLFFGISYSLMAYTCFTLFIATQISYRMSTLQFITQPA